MQLLDIGPDTERAFFCCLWEKSREGPESAVHRRERYEQFKCKGYSARVLLLDDGQIVDHAEPRGALDQLDSAIAAVAIDHDGLQATLQRPQMRQPGTDPAFLVEDGYDKRQHLPGLARVCALST